MDRTPRPGEFYRHFKDKLYQIVCLAHHSETDEILVVYQALYGEFKICARPLEMFTSEVDHEKYPDAAQKYRFERISVEQIQKLTDDRADSRAAVVLNSSGVEQESDIAHKLTEFLDAENYREKLLILDSMKNSMNKELIDSIALSLDMPVKPGTIEEQYGQLIYGIKTLMRFEDTRLRQ